VQDRIRAYYEKYLPLAQEITDEQVAESGAKPGTPKFDKTKRAMITTRLNARPRKIEIVESEPVPVAAVGGPVAAVKKILRDPNEATMPAHA